MMIIALLASGILGTLGSIITLSDGTIVQGVIEDNVAAFKGIPFAQAPIGNLRWAPPLPWQNNNISQVLDATRFGSVCTQYMWGHDDIGELQGGNEDCLFLNIYVKLDNNNEPSSTPLPVAIWNHGGAYIEGASSLFLYDGIDAVNYWDGKAILVTTNYRLGIFGFLGSEELRSQDPAFGSSGNYGMQDQRMAFEWVQKNIGSFGGDKNKVTIFGESAGAHSMSNHLTMKKSWGLFHSVVLESGSFSEDATQSMAQAQLVYDDVRSRAGCPDLNCLLQLSTHDVLRLAKKNMFGYAPVVDNVELFTAPWVAVANGDVADVPIMHGSNSDEGAIFTTLPHDCTQETLEKYWSVEGYTADEIAVMESIYFNQSYPEFNGATMYWWAAQRSWGDEVMSCPAKYASQQLAKLQESGKRSSNTYLYYNTHTPRNASVVRHVSEIPYVFHLNQYTRHPDDRLMANAVSSYWFNFFSAHDPNSPRTLDKLNPLPNFSRYESAKDNSVVLHEYNDITELSGLKNDICGFFIPRITKSVSNTYSV